jgi:hypothetical protein
VTSLKRKADEALFFKMKYSTSDNNRYLGNQTSNDLSLTPQTVDPNAASVMPHASTLQEERKFDICSKS